MRRTMIITFVMSATSPRHAGVVLAGTVLLAVARRSAREPLPA